MGNAFIFVLFPSLEKTYPRSHHSVQGLYLEIEVAKYLLQFPQTQRVDQSTFKYPQVLLADPTCSIDY